MNGHGLGPLRTMGAGMLLVIVDIRLDGVDLVPDPIGWVLVVAAATRLVNRHDAFRYALTAAAVGLLLSLADVVAPAAGALAVLETVAHTAYLFATCTGIADLAPRHATVASRLRWWDLGAVAVVLATGAAAGADPAMVPGLAAVGLLAALVAIVVSVWFVVLLFQAGREAPGPVAGNSWKSTPNPA